MTTKEGWPSHKCTYCGCSKDTVHGIEFCLRCNSSEALERIDRAEKRIEVLESFIRETVELYGKPGGPWNVPSDPGSWLERAKKLGAGK